MKNVMIASTAVAALFAFAGPASAQTCGKMSSVQACYTCSVAEGGLNRFPPEGIRAWCRGRMAQNATKKFQVRR